MFLFFLFFKSIFQSDVLHYENLNLLVFQFQEMDFLYEARNSERCLLNFIKLSPYLARYIYAPKVYWDLSTSKVLSMEFIEGAEITDVTAIRKLGIHPKDVAKLVCKSPL